MLIFYHNDMDGKCAAHIIHYFGTFGKYTQQHVNDLFYPIRYGVKFPLDKIEKGERVYILDYSIEPDEMTKLLEITEDVVWIDHHQSAIEKFSEFAWRNSKSEWCNWEDIKGIRQIGKAGCELSYNWLFNQQDIPEYILLISDRDTWAWEYGDRAKFFHAGLESHDTSPASPIWRNLQQDKDSYLVNIIIESGQVVQRYKDQVDPEYIRDHGFWVDFEGYKCYAVNGKFSSQPMSLIAPGAAIWLTFRYVSEGYWIIRLYSETIEVNKIAERYSYHGKWGGGHKKAAGFECTYPPFLT